MKNTLPANETSLVLLPPARKRSCDIVARPKRSYTMKSVRKTLREQAAGLRNAALAMYILAALTVVIFCSCNGIAKDIYMAIQYLTLNIIDEETGNIVSLVCCIIGLLLGGFTAIVGIFLDSSAEALKAESRKLNKEV